MTNGDALKWLENLKHDIGKPQHSELWHYEQALSEIEELLKEKQPRVLTIREIPQFINKPVYFETWNFQTWAIITAHYGDSITLIFRESETRRCFDFYEKYFRLWDKEPTDEQRKAEPWKDGEQE